MQKHLWLHTEAVVVKVGRLPNPHNEYLELSLPVSEMSVPLKFSYLPAANITLFKFQKT